MYKFIVRVFRYIIYNDHHSVVCMFQPSIFCTYISCVITVDLVFFANLAFWDFSRNLEFAILHLFSSAISEFVFLAKFVKILGLFKKFRIRNSAFL